MVSGQVVRVYQRARNGSKVLVDFGPAIGIQDTWWERATPPRGKLARAEEKKVAA